METKYEYHPDHDKLRKIISRYNRLKNQREDKLKGGFIETAHEILEQYRQNLLGNVVQFFDKNDKYVLSVSASYIAKHVDYDQKSVQNHLHRLMKSKIFSIKNEINLPYWNYFKIVVPMSYFYERGAISRHTDNPNIEI